MSSMEKLYINGHKIYKEVSLNYILKKIQGIKSLAPTNLYIHGPFCINLCNFCQHQGIQLRNNLEILNQYYKVYLPGLIKEFESTIKQLTIDSIYFGGGTADLIPEEHMQQLFDCIPNFKSIPCKIFEAHPASLTRKQIDILHANNFDSGYISFGIQTFNKQITDNENRIYVSPDKILNKLNYIYKKGIFVNIDLVAYLNIEDISLLENDLSILFNNGEPDIITIYPLRQAFNYLNQKSQEILPENTDLANHLISENNKKYQDIEDVIFNTLLKFPKYHQWVSKENREAFNDNVTSNRGKPYYLTRHKDSIVDEKRAYNSSTPPFHNINSNTLGFGNYKRVYSHSYIEDQLVFYTMNDNWETRYFAVHDETDLELNRKTIGWNDVINL